MTPQEQSEVLARTKTGPVGVKVENYKIPPTGGALPGHKDGERG